MSDKELLKIYQRIGEAIGEDLETIISMHPNERDGLIVTLGLEETVKKAQEKGNQSSNTEADDLTLDERISIAIGEPLESVKNMSRRERTQLVSALGLEQFAEHESENSESIDITDDAKNTSSAVIDVADISTDDDDVVAVNDASSNDGESVAFDVNTSASVSGVARGWGECPVCDQILPNDKLQLHAMACQGIQFNGGEGLEVNPMDVQSKCTMCGCLVPDLVMLEHRETCWANDSKKRRIETPLERRRTKYPKTTYWASAPKK